jgi:predicted RNA-binding protein (virulence factor B family)
MSQIGKYNTLPVVSKADFGVYLDAGPLETILLPKRQVPEGCNVGDELEVFIYHDSEDRLIATMEKTKAQVGECACLEVKDVSKFGAFLDWGLQKDLLVPMNQMRKPMEAGEKHVVYLYLDEFTDRIAATAKLSNFLREETTNYQKNDRVSMMIVNRTNIGYKVIIDQLYLGVLFNDDVLKPLKPGQKVMGYIKNVREDNKLDVQLQLQGHEARVDIGDRIMQRLADQDGCLLLSDKSSPDEIYAQFQVSKGNFKKAIGRLLKQNQIVIEPNRILLP